MNFYEPIEIIVNRSEGAFDRASDEAYRTAILKFGIDSMGYTDKVEKWERTKCCIVIEFKSYQRTMNAHTYTFSAWAEKVDD